MSMADDELRRVVGAGAGQNAELKWHPTEYAKSPSI